MKKLNVKIKTALSVAGLLVLTVLLSNCSGSSDPMSGYNLKGVPLHKDDNQTQTFCDVDPISLEIANENYGQFIQGKPGKIQIKATSTLGTPVSVDLDTDFPYADKPVKSVSGIVTTFSWTPKAGTVPSQLDSTAFAFHVNATTSYEKCAFNKPMQVNITVNRTDSKTAIQMAPVILPEVVYEGNEPVKFYIDVTDPLYDGTTNPEIGFTGKDYANKEAYTANVVPTENTKQQPNPVVLDKSTGRIRFYYEIDISKLPVDYNRVAQIDTNSAKVRLCFNVNAYHFNSSNAGKQEACIREARYAAQPPVITWENDDVKATAGSEKQFKFSVTTANGLAQFDKDKASTDLTAQIKGLSGTKSISCVDSKDGNKALDCTLSWTPDCKKKSVSTKVDLKVQSILGKTTSKSNAPNPKILTVEESAANCAAPAPVVAAKTEVKAEAPKADATAVTQTKTEKVKTTATSKKKKPVKKSDSTEQKS